MPSFAAVPFERLESLHEDLRCIQHVTTLTIDATGILLKTASGTVVLFFIGRHHAGEIFDGLLARRKPAPGTPRLMKVTDAASKNFDHRHRQKVVEATWSAHAFLKLRDVKEQHAAEYAQAGGVYGAVFDNDDEAKRRRLTPDERRLFLRECSSFIINRWPRLTRFGEVPGVPLDSSLVKQKLIIPVRSLAASFNEQTVTGAEVDDRMMSLIAAGRANGVGPIGSITHCLRHHAELARRPADFLPWASAHLALPRTPPLWLNQIIEHTKSSDLKHDRQHEHTSSPSRTTHNQMRSSHFELYLMSTGFTTFTTFTTSTRVSGLWRNSSIQR